MPPAPPVSLRVGGRRRMALLAVVATTAAAVLGGMPSARAEAVAGAARPPVHYSDGAPHDARLTIASIGIARLPVLAYRGKTDDAPGTVIQNRGIAASPYGPDGGVGPGGLGNYQVTAHRVSHGGIFRRTPSLEDGAKIFIDAGSWRYVYQVVTTRWVSFRSATSLRAQRAPVPGHPGKIPERGYLTLSTCATPEDHAAGNFWADRFGNPEHRIDKIAVLVARVARPGS